MDGTAHTDFRDRHVAREMTITSTRPCFQVAELRALTGARAPGCPVAALFDAANRRHRHDCRSPRASTASGLESTPMPSFADVRLRQLPRQDSGSDRRPCVRSP